MAKTHSDIGLIGLAVMGQNLALNIADHGFRISVYNRTTEKTDAFVAENPNTPGGLVGTKTLEEFAASLSKPRKAIILVQAGKATDAVIDGLASVFEAGDIIIDGGNALWTDTIRREKEQTIDHDNLDGVTYAGWSKDSAAQAAASPTTTCAESMRLVPVMPSLPILVRMLTRRPIG